jgi:hypothetical protein
MTKKRWYSGLSLTSISYLVKKIAGVGCGCWEKSRENPLHGNFVMKFL